VRLPGIGGRRLRHRPDHRHRRRHDELIARPGGTVLITLGRLPKGLKLARAFHGAGCRVVVAEPHRWHLSRLSRSVDKCVRVPAPNTDEPAYLEALARVVAREGVDLVVPVSDETMYVGGLHDYLPAQVRLYCPPPARLLALHDKLEFVRLAARHGLEVPETCHAADPAARALLERTRCIVKPVWSSAGVGLRVLERGAPLDTGPDEDAVVQAYVPGAELCTFSITHEGRVIGTVVYRGRIMSGTVAVCFERLVEPPPAVLDWVERFAAATAHSGFLCFDMRMDAAGRPLAIECNPRTTSGIHFVEPVSLAAAILDPAGAAALALRQETVLQQFFPALTELQSDALAGRRVRDRLPLLFGTRDVSWQADDPLPLLLQPAASWEILRRSLFRRESFGEAATFDIAWHAPGASRTE
jgi:predicted ATP-grasp superfamily ATP-dependent carboligase